MENAQLKTFIHLIAKEMSLMAAHERELGRAIGSEGSPPYDVGVVHRAAKENYQPYLEAVEEIYDASKNDRKLAERTFAEQKPSDYCISQHRRGSEELHTELP